jgi:hypothetical protein
MCCAAYVTLFAEVGQDSDLAIERLNSHQRAYFTPGCPSLRRQKN